MIKTGTYVRILTPDLHGETGTALYRGAGCTSWIVELEPDGTNCVVVPTSELEEVTE